MSSQSIPSLRAARFAFFKAVTTKERVVKVVRIKGIASQVSRQDNKVVEISCGGHAKHVEAAPYWVCTRGIGGGGGVEVVRNVTKVVARMYGHNNQFKRSLKTILFLLFTVQIMLITKHSFCFICISKQQQPLLDFKSLTNCS